MDKRNQYLRKPNAMATSSQHNIDPDALFSGISEGNPIALARAITLAESTHPDHRAAANILLEACLQRTTKSIRLGITGVPGVGKSTFIEALGLHLVDKGLNVAVLAVDPSSSLSKGSILGDKTRMPELAKHPNAFIRPSPSGTALGGVGQRTKEAILLCEAAGYEVILVETIGVGQSETMVHQMVDFFLLLKIAGAGDELQGIKRGIMEMTDAIAINKADAGNEQKAALAKAEFEKALHLYPPKKNGWIPKVVTCSALEHKGIAELWGLVETYSNQMKATGQLEQHRTEQNLQWTMETVNQGLRMQLEQLPKMQEHIQKALKQVQNHEATPFRAAQDILAHYQKELK